MYMYVCINAVLTGVQLCYSPFKNFPRLILGFELRGEMEKTAYVNILTA